jgi:hypothetical protein
MGESPPVLWIVHLLGGVRAAWGDDGQSSPVKVEPDLMSGKSLEFTGSSLGQVIQHCNTLGLQSCGAGLYTNELELKGIVPAQWRTIHYLPNSAWLCYEAQETWSEIAYAARKNQIGRLWDCSARIAYQFTTCISRLQDISNGYASQLQSLVTKKAFPHGSCIENLWTQAVFRSIQAFLAEACILRDYLAEFTAEYVYRAVVRTRITTLAKLVPHLRSGDFSGKLATELRLATDPNGWLAMIGDYRNLVVHSAPLAMAKKHLWVLCQAHYLPTGEGLPSVRFPLPADPAGIMALRRESDYADFSALADRFSGPADVDSSMKDAFHYLHEVLGKLGELATALAHYSPVAPEMPVLTDEDIVGPIEWEISS